MTNRTNLASPKARHRRWFSKPSALALVALALVVSCFHGPTAPLVSARGTLAPGTEASSSRIASELPFGVVFGSPQGETVDPTEIALVFNRPMRSLDLAGAEVSPPVTMTPTIPGSWHWIGTSGLLFAPEKGLLRATRYTVEVAAGTRALDGSVLAQPYRLTFSTPAPALVKTVPEDGEDHIVPNTKFKLRFNQPIETAEVVRAVRLAVGQEKPQAVAFDATRPNPHNPLEAEITPRSPLPLASAIVLTVDGSLRGIEGPRTPGTPSQMIYHTYGPLTVGHVECSTDTPTHDCSPRSSISLTLSNAAKVKDIRAAIGITPPIVIDWWETPVEDRQTRYVHLRAAFAPGRTYSIRIKGDLQDRYGQKLGRDVVLTTKFGDLWPSASIGVEGTYFDAKAVRDIAVASVNVKSLDLVTVPLDPEAVSRIEWATRGVRFDQLMAMRGARSTRLRPAAATNATSKEIVRPHDVLGGPESRGPLAVGIRYTARPDTPQARVQDDHRVIQVTDLAISAKLSRFGSLVWVTRLSDGRPVDGAEVRIRHPPGASAGETVLRTDAAGMALVPANALSPAYNSTETPIIFVRNGSDWAYRNASDLVHTWRFGVGSDPTGSLEPIGMVFSDRGVFRPGDTVKIKGIFRQELPRGMSTPGGTAVRIKVSASSDEPVVDKRLQLSEYGTFSVDAPIPKSAELGTYSIDVMLDPDHRQITDASSTFEVEEYRPAEFRVSAEPGQRSYVRGDRGAWIVRGDYLFGARMSHAKVHTSITRNATSFSIPDLEDYSISDAAVAQDGEDISPRGGPIQSSDAQLDDAGAVKVEVPLTLPGQVGPEAVTCDAEVTDVSRQAGASSSTVIVHPGEFYVALQAGDESHFIKSGDEIAPRVLAAEPSGKRRAGVAVDIDLIQRSWVVAREAVGQGRVRSVSRHHDTVVGHCSVTTGTNPVSCKLRPNQAGYAIVRAKAKDSRNNALASSTGLYVLGEGAAGWNDTDDGHVELATDRSSYEVGQTAHIVVRSPFTTAQALVTVERSGIYSQRWLQLRGPMPTIDVPITDELRPNAYMSVVLVRGRTKAPPTQWNAADVGAPAFRVGYANLVVNRDARRLTVEIKTDKRDYRPGERVEVDLQLRDRDKKGTQAELTLFAVDEGVLMLTGYKTPDPIPTFTATRPLRVGYLESRSDLAKLTLDPTGGLGGVDKGLEGGGGGGVRRTFEPSAYFNPTIVTDAEGHAHASFRLPDSLTTYRIMAVAVARDDRFGFGDTSVTASRPLMARPAFPRILRVGDEFQAGVVITSKGLGSLRATVKLDSSGIDLVGDSRREIELGPGQSREVAYPLRATKAGNAMFRFAVEGGGQRDAVEFGRRIDPPMQPETVALYGETRSVAGEKLGDLSAARDDVGGVDVSVASTALVGLGGSVEELLDYPYLCTEQLTSRLVPLLPLRSLARDFGLRLPNNADAVVVNTVAEILKRQRGDGGFGMWPDSPAADPWATTYALWGLGMASRHGAAVPKAKLVSATRYVRLFLESWDRRPLGETTAAFMLDVLAENGAPDPGYMTRLYDARSRMPLFARACLLHAMAVGKGDPSSIEELRRDLEAHVRIEGNKAILAENVGDAYASLMDSSARTLALALRAVVASQPGHPLAARLARALLEARKGGKWQSTQESAFALLALDEFRKAQEKAIPNFVARVWLGADPVLDTPMTGRSAMVVHAFLPAATAFRAGGSTLAFQMAGEQQGTLYYEARLKYARKELPREPLERGFFVQKSMRVVAPDAIESALRTVAPTQHAYPEPHAGDLVLVDLIVTSPQPHEFVVIDDPLPAGLEAVNSRLATAARWLHVSGSGGEDDSLNEAQDDEEREERIARGGAFLTSWFREELRDDRVLYFVDHLTAGMVHYRYLARAVTRGSFLLPPTKVEAMYQPDVFGRSAGALFRVVGP